MTDTETYFCFEFSPDPPFFIRLDDQVVVIEVLDDEALLLVHREQDLLHGGVAAQGDAE